MATLPILTGLEQIAARYETFIVDLWGVMHDGVEAYPAAVVALEALRDADKTIIILSNAPRRAASVRARNAELGIAETLCDLVMSSGEATWRHLQARDDPWYAALGRRCHHLGPVRDLGLREGLDLQFVETLDEADFLLVTGTLDNDHTLDHYAQYLAQARALDLPLICANPDLEVIRGGRRELCAGSLAAHYQELGGKVRSHGKPDPAIYRDCLGRLGLTAGPGVLAIGDSLRTDVAGARAAGLSVLFVAGGIHAEALGLTDAGAFDAAELQRLCDQRGCQPDAAIDRLRW